MVQLIYYPSKMYMDCRVLFYILEKSYHGIWNIFPYQHLSVESISGLYLHLSQDSWEKVFVYIFKHCLLTIADDTETFFSLPGLLTPSLFL